MAHHPQSLFLFPAGTLVPAPLVHIEAAQEESHPPAVLQPVPGELVIDLETFAVLAGPPSLELVDVCARAPFHAAAAYRDSGGTWQYIAPRVRAAVARTAEVRVVYLSSGTDTEMTR